MNKFLESHNLLKLNNKFEIKNRIPFILGQRNEIDMNLTKYYKILCTDNYRALMKEIKEDINKWKYILRSWIGRHNIVKIQLLPN